MSAGGADVGLVAAADWHPAHPAHRPPWEPPLPACAQVTVLLVQVLLLLLQPTHGFDSVTRMTTFNLS
jgi:hypothetical protein